MEIDDDNDETEDVEEKGSTTLCHPALVQCQLNRFDSKGLPLI